MSLYKVEVRHYGYTEILTIAAESKYLALARARELRKGLDCRFPKEKK